MVSGRAGLQGSNEEKSRQYFSLWMNVGLCEPWMKVLHLGERREMKQGDTLYGEGDTVDGFYFLLTGLMRFVSYDSLGNEAILFYATDRNLVGDSSYFNRMPVYGFFSAIEDCTLYYFSNSVLKHQIFTRHPELIHNLLEYMSYKVGVLLHHQCEVISGDIIGKVCRMIFDIAKYNSFAASVNSRITQKEMATALSLHRSTFSRVINELKVQEVLEWTGKQEIRIYNYDELQRLANNVFAI